MTRRALAVLATLLLGGCGEDVTEVVVVADTDMGVPSDVDAIHFVIDATEIEGQVQETTADLKSEAIALPVILPLVHEGGPLGPVTVTATALKSGDPVVSRSARFDFIRGRSVILPIDLLSECVEATCEPGETCGAGGCVPIDVSPRRSDAGMPSADAGGPGGDGGPSSAGAGPGDPDAGPLCPIGCPCVQDCTADDCLCEGGCACDLSCQPGTDCRKIHCDGPGTVCTLTTTGAEDAEDVKCDHGASCTFDARGLSNVRVVCDHESRCDVDCTGASNCTVECKNGSRCTVDCNGTSNCELVGCEGDVESCGTVAACGLECD